MFEPWHHALSAAASTSCLASWRCVNTCSNSTGSYSGAVWQSLGRFTHTHSHTLPVLQTVTYTNVIKCQISLSKYWAPAVARLRDNVPLEQPVVFLWFKVVFWVWPLTRPLVFPVWERFLIDAGESQTAWSSRICSAHVERIKTILVYLGTSCFFQSSDNNFVLIHLFTEEILSFRQLVCWWSMTEPMIVMAVLRFCYYYCNNNYYYY